MDNRFSITNEALDSFRANLARVKQPGNVKTAKLAPQELCGMVDEVNGALFPAVELISFSLSAVATNRLQTVGNNIRIPNADSMEQKGSATIRVNGKTFTDVPMHLPVALAFALQEKIDLSATIGKIESRGAKNGKYWLSLSMETDLTTEQKVQALNVLYGIPEEPKQEQKPVIENATFEPVPEEPKEEPKEEPEVTI